MLFDSEFCSVIIEPRSTVILQYVLESIHLCTPENTLIIILHGKKNKSYCQELLEKLHFSKRILLKNLNIENFTWNEYANFCKSKEYLNLIPTKYFLKFETDSFLLRTINVEKWKKYAYVGAPWKNTTIKGGNGGLSFRNKEWMQKCIDLKEMVNIKEEDVFFSVLLTKLNAPLPDLNTAKKFSVEHIYYKSPVGCHQPWYSCDSFEKLKKMIDSAESEKIRKLAWKILLFDYRFFNNENLLLLNTSMF